MLPADGLPPIREVLDRLGIRPARRYGQHFIHDLNFTHRIAGLAGGLADRQVLEVGAGVGGLTRALLSLGARRVFAIETDPRCIPALAEISERWPGRLVILQEDALHAELPPPDAPSLDIVANLPYGIAAPLLTKWISTASWPPWWGSATVMLQQEMARRIVSDPGSRSYGRLSVLLQWRANPRILADVPPAVFVPPPRVESCLLQMTPRPAPEAGFAPETLSRVTAAAFGNRRKTLRKSLQSLTPDPAALLARCGIDPGIRAEAVPVAGFCALARAWGELAEESARNN